MVLDAIENSPYDMETAIDSDSSINSSDVRSQAICGLGISARVFAISIY